jgi:hypothetical protein
MITTLVKKILMRAFAAISPLPQAPARKVDPIERQRQHYRRGKRATQHLGTDRVARTRSAVLDLGELS